ncbi:hypothetical protein B0J12DRAFT_59389 [Macrophomina phaseolina]|uniref:Uncharacterized protein n=1 Tax=Macrophomina phaseolina TaxID=35725 RepID=A0ABQ8FSZ6_9PEZI|nr:hypothetical protein B0J12DRAFT_59389 [Macrophomina phaseolina]
MAPSPASLSQEERQHETRAPSNRQRVTRQQSTTTRPHEGSASHDTIHVHPAPEAPSPKVRRVAFNEALRSKIWDYESQIKCLQRKEEFSRQGFLKLEEELAQLAEQNQELEGRVVQLSEQNQELEEKVEQLIEEKELDKEIEQLLGNDEHLENQAQKLQNKVEESTTQAQIDNLTRQVQQLTERLNTLSTAPQANNPSWATVVARPTPKFPLTYNTQSGNNPATLRIITAPPSTKNMSNLGGPQARTR